MPLNSVFCFHIYWSFIENFRNVTMATKFSLIVVSKKQIVSLYNLTVIFQTASVFTSFSLAHSLVIIHSVTYLNAFTHSTAALADSHHRMNHVYLWASILNPLTLYFTLRSALSRRTIATMTMFQGGGEVREHVGTQRVFKTNLKFTIFC